MTIVHQQVRKHHSKEIASVKLVLRHNHSSEEATFEADDDMKLRNPHLFDLTCRLSFNLCSLFNEIQNFLFYMSC